MSPSEERFERLVTEMLLDVAPQRPPADLIPNAERAVDGTRRWPRWIASIKEPPMRHSSTLAVGSPTVRVAAILAATLLIALTLAGAGVAGARQLAADDPIIVDQSGAGDATTITEAVRMAGDGDTILIRPGTYTEAVVVDKDVEITGDGPRESIVWTAPPDGPTRRVDVNSGHPYAVLIDDARARLANLTFAGQASAIHVDGGAPTVEHLLLDGVGQPHTHSSGRYGFTDGIAITGPSRAVVRDNTLRDGGPIAGHTGSEPLIVGNELTDGPSILVYAPGDEMVVRGNSVSGSIDRGIGVFGPSRITIEDNIVTDAGGAGISVGRGTGVGNDPLVRGNTISRTHIGIEVAIGAAPRIESNSIDGSGTGIGAGSSTDGLIATGNELRDNDRGIRVVSSGARFEENVVQGGDIGALSVGGSPTFLRNTVEGSASRGFVIRVQSSPVLTGNRICSLGDQVVVDEETTDEFDSTNEICEDAATE
jgi:hypothetical protein